MSLNPTQVNPNKIAGLLGDCQLVLDGRLHSSGISKSDYIRDEQDATIPNCMSAEQCSEMMDETWPQKTVPKTRRADEAINTKEPVGYE